LNPVKVTKGITEMLFPFLFDVHALVHANGIFLDF